MAGCLCMVSGLIGSLLVSVPSAAADPSGSSAATLTIAVRSISVTPGTTTYNTCVDSNNNPSTGLVLPNGACDVKGPNVVTVTNGGVASNVDVQVSGAVPADNGNPWTPCVDINTCTGGSGMPGVDQFKAHDVGPGAAVVWANGTPQCDLAFGGGPSCAATAGQSAQMELILIGPTSSTDTSSSFTTTWTWTAVP